MEAFEAINLVETVLRRLVRSVLGDAWQSASGINITYLEAKRTEDQAKRRGTFVTDDLIAYTEFTQLVSVITSNWSSFQPALGKQKYFATYMDRLGGFRNPTMHARELRGFERDLVNGIVGEITIQIAINRSAGKGPDMNYYPTIESITDQFGRSTPTQNSFTMPPVRVEVGDQIEFTCHGNDPQEHELIWELRPNNNPSYGSVGRGEDVVLSWTVHRDHVRDQLIVWIRMSSDGEYHGMGHCDGETAFIFSINPPMG